MGISYAYGRSARDGEARRGGVLLAQGGFHLVGRHRAGEEVALHALAAGGTQEQGLALVLDALYLKRAWQLLRSERAELPMRAFRFSINYLALLFAALLVDHYLPRAPF